MAIGLVMKATGETMSPCKTPRAMLKGADVSTFPSGFVVLTHPDAALKIDLVTLCSFTDVPAHSALSRNVRLTVSNAAV